ncbi:cytochrome P450 2K1-like [Protopterus annectens]|uniref:cytochrome P450 2K1-like n=1 Tax=Protopterus annectens TaxID=7888 RepID=UPI001CFB7F1E|nr:cytochrome P450 2K1-like [Protopterus annectens]
MSLLNVMLGESTVFLVVILAFFCIHFYIKSIWSSPKNFPRGPTPLPLIGNLHLLDLKRPQNSLMKLAEKYGNIYTFHMGLQKLVVLAGYEMVKDALVNHAYEFGDRGHVPIFEETAQGNGLSFGRGESWKQMRRFTLTTLRDFGMGKKTIADRIVEETTYLIEVLKSYKGLPFENTMIINSAVSNIICSIVFGERFDYKDEKFIGILKVMNEFVKLSGSPMSQLFNCFPFLRFLPGDHKSSFQKRRALFDYLNKAYLDFKSKLNPNDLRSYIEAFIVKQEEEVNKMENVYFHEKNFLVSTSNLFSAGTETTSTSLRWGFLLLMKYPEVQRKVHEEIDHVIGSERNPTIEDRKNMPYTNAVLHEILRFGNVIPLNLQHETAMDTHFRGYFLPKGTQVIPLLTSVLFDKSQWETPNEFNPSHFIGADGKFVKRDAFLPFSAGRRVCLGETLAKMELFLFFTVLLQRFTLLPPPGITEKDLDLEPITGGTCAPKPYEMCAISR